MTAIIGIVIAFGLFALGAVARLMLGARGMRWAFGWKAWVALGAGVGLLLVGRWGAALAFGALGLYLAWPRGRAAPDPPDLTAARSLLGVARGASPTAIREAYRRKIARAHPDAGGSVEEAQRLTQARDRLLNGR